MTHPRARRLAAVTRFAPAAVLAIGAVLCGALVADREARAADPVPDYGLFLEKIEPVLQQVCAQCHAGKGKGQFGLIVHAQGAPFPDAEHRVNYATVLKLLTPGKPDASKFLLKPLAMRDGGAKHEGGDRIFKGTPAYRAWVDFINGVKGDVPAPTPAMAAGMTAAPGQPDLGYFIANVEPVLLGVCSQCHAGKGKGQFAVIVHTGGTRFPLEDHRKNYETVLKLLVPGKPEQSKFLLKPLAVRDGGVKHEGGDRFSKGDATHARWVDFINGVKGPPVPSDAPPEPEAPSADEKGLVLEAEAAVLSGDAAAGKREGVATPVVLPGAGGGRATVKFRASRTGEYLVTFRAFPAPGGRGLRLRLDGGEALEVAVPEALGAGGMGAGATAAVEVGPKIPLDGSRPLDGRLGRLVPKDGVLEMDGRDGTARFLSPADLPHTKVEATFTLPAADDPGRDDAWLLFDCLDRENGKFFGLYDAGRKVVMGVLEAGRPRIVKSLPRQAVADSTAPVKLTVDLTDGIAVGRIDGKPLLYVNFDRGLGAARFGAMTHGRASLNEMAAFHGANEVHRMKLGEGGIMSLRRGEHTIVVELLPGGAALDAIVVKEVSP